MSQRIKGQEVIISIIVDGELQTRIDSIQDASIEFDLEILNEGYLGETADRYDEIFNGVSFECSYHLSNQQALILAQAIANKAQRRAGGAVRIDVAGTFAFPNGDFPSLLLPDLSFGAIPFDVGGRGEYVKGSLTGKGSGFKIVT